MANRSDFSRTDRIRKAIIREFSDILSREIQDPQFQNQLISVTDVDVSNDMRHAKIFLSIMGEPEHQQQLFNLLNEYKPRIRHELGQRIRLRYTPDLELNLDDSLERGARVTQLLNQISRGEV